MMLHMQEGKTVAMMALEGGTDRDGYSCLLLVVAAGVDLHHKSDVSFSIDAVVIFFSSFPI